MSIEDLDNAVKSREKEIYLIKEKFRRRYFQEVQLYSFASLNEMLNFVQEEDVSKGLRELLLATFQAQIIQFFGGLDESGISALVGTEEVYKVYREFSFSKDKNFQTLERKYLSVARNVVQSQTRRHVSEPYISEEAWDIFWIRADRGKELILNRMQECLTTGEPFSFGYFLPEIYKIESDSFELIHFSPFKWKRFAVACLGGLLGVGNLTAGIPTLGTALASIAPAAGAILVAVSGEMTS